MARIVFVSLCAVILCQSAAHAQSAAAGRGKSPRYGANPAAGKTFTHDGIRLYYEVYGSGEPLLLIHGNGSSIGELTAQIDFFRKRYQVIAMDSRDHGKSGDGPAKPNYERMAADLAALLEHLKSPPVNVLGWSDGGIEALILGMKYPAKVKKLAVMAANLYPDGLAPEALAWIKNGVSSMSAADKATPQGKRDYKLSQMMLEEPRIDPKSLAAIKVPTLILAADHDAIRDEHTLEIYHAIPNSQLSIFPNATHMIPYDDPELFNSTVDRFLRTPFVKKDRMKDLLKSMEASKKSLQ